MSIFAGIFNKVKDQVIQNVGGLVDTINTSDEEKSALKNQLTEVVLSALNTITQLQTQIITTEMKGNWLQRSWRPILMLTFGFILVSIWFGWTDPDISEELEMKLMSIIEIGLGGYVIGRSAEKIASSVTQNIDIPFLKKKDRQV